MAKQARAHEWAWSYEGERTVCGLTPQYLSTDTYRPPTVRDLGKVASRDRCKNCERMRDAVGMSGRQSKLESAAEPAARQLELVSVTVKMQVMTNIGARELERYLERFIDESDLNETLLEEGESIAFRSTDIALVYPEECQ